MAQTSKIDVCGAPYSRCDRIWGWPSSAFFYGLNHLHYLTTSNYRRPRLFDSERFQRNFIKVLALTTCLHRLWAHFPFAFRHVTLFVVGVAGHQSEDKPTQHQRAEGENAVADHAQPAKLIHSGGVEKLRGAGIPRAILDRRPRLHQSDGQHADQHHQRQADVDGPEGKPQRTVFPGLARSQGAQAEEHQAKTQHAVHPEKRRVRVHGVVFKPCM